MANITKINFLEKLAKKFGSLKKIGTSLSLYEIGDGAARIYIRYSKVHSRKQTFYGLRQEDLKILGGFPSVLCFLWNDQSEPLFIPFEEYDEVFQSVSPASDGQYKAQIYLANGVEFYIAGAGRFNVETHFGWDKLDILVNSAKLKPGLELSHYQIQTYLGAIGAAKGYDIWIPNNDRARLERGLTEHFECRNALPFKSPSVEKILQAVDTVWIERGSNKLRALFEVEHSTPIYSGLLRFNDIHLVDSSLRPRFSIVANDSRRVLFSRQVSRPTFQASGLNKLCTFFEYANVVEWYDRIQLGRE